MAGHRGLVRCVLQVNSNKVGAQQAKETNSNGNRRQQRCLISMAVCCAGGCAQKVTSGPVWGRTKGGNSQKPTNWGTESAIAINWCCQCGVPGGNQRTVVWSAAPVHRFPRWGMF